MLRNLQLRNFQFINRNINRNIIRGLYGKKSTPNINIFIRNAITQLKTKEEIEKTEEVVNSLKSITTNNYNPVFLTNILNANTQKENIASQYTPKEFRNNRLDLVSNSDVFVFIYDENALSVSGGVELGYWIANNEYANQKDTHTHTVIILMNNMSTTLLKMLPNTTYIQVNKYSHNLDESHYPNLIKLSSVSELPDTFTTILNKLV